MVDNLRNNFQIVKSLVGNEVKVMVLIKANGYGHGMLRVARELLDEGADYIGLAYLEEAIYLRKNGITAPIAVLGAINVNQIEEFIKHDIELTSSSLDKSKAISDAAKRLGKNAVIHLKIDTGMERIGVHYYNAQKFISETLSLPNITFNGVFSHFAKSDCDKAFTEEQIKRFDGVVNFLEKEKITPPLIHLANSEGIINFKESHYNMVRPGIMLYGYATKKDFGERQLLPVMNLLTKVSYFKVVPADTGVSYCHTYKTKEQTRIVTLPLGYGDGYTRALSNKGLALIRGKTYPMVGNICMDQIMVDLGPNGEAYNNDDVLLFGKLGGDTIELEELCEKIGSIPYELLCLVNSRVPRIYK
jgi:alanine racemase